jgi:hypothetical protein
MGMAKWLYGWILHVVDEIKKTIVGFEKSRDVVDIQILICLAEVEVGDT